MSCPDETRFVKWIGGELSPSDAQALQQHLASCAPCKARAEEIHAVWDQLGAWQVSPPSDRIVGRVLAAAAQPARVSRVQPALRLAASLLLAAAGGVIAATFVPNRTPIRIDAQPTEQAVADAIGLDLWNDNDLLFSSLLTDPDAPDQEPS